MFVRATHSWLKAISFVCLSLLALAGTVVPLVVAQSATVTSIPIPSRPLYIAYDSNKGEVFVGQDYSLNDTISVVSDTSNTVVANISLKSTSEGGATLAGLAFDSGKDEIFASYSLSLSHCFCRGGYVAVISDNSNSVVANVSLGAFTTSNFGSIAYDSGKGEVFATINDTVAIISDASNSIVGTVMVGNGPTGLAYDSGKGEVFVADDGDYDGAVAVVSDSSNTVVANITEGQLFNAASLTYDGGKGEVFVAAFGYARNDSVLVYSDATNSMIAKIPLVSTINFQGVVAYDSAKGEVFVPDGDQVCVLSDSSNTLLGSVSLLPQSGSSSAAYDSSKGEIFVTDWGTDAVSIIPDSVSLASSTSTTASSVPATTSTTISPSSSTSSSIPEFPFGPFSTIVFAILIVGAYFAMRRVGLGRTDREGTGHSEYSP